MERKQTISAPFADESTIHMENVRTLCISTFKLFTNLNSTQRTALTYLTLRTCLALSHQIITAYSHDRPCFHYTRRGLHYWNNQNSNNLKVGLGSQSCFTTLYLFPATQYLASYITLNIHYNDIRCNDICGIAIFSPTIKFYP